MNLTAIQGMLPILAVCAAIFFLLFMRPRQKLVLRFLLRFIVGILGIVVGNTVVGILFPAVHVGLNPATLLTCAILGFPGVCGLFVLSLL